MKQSPSEDTGKSIEEMLSHLVLTEARSYCEGRGATRGQRIGFFKLKQNHLMQSQFDFFFSLILQFSVKEDITT